MATLLRIATVRSRLFVTTKSRQDLLAAVVDRQEAELVVEPQGQAV